MKFFLRLQSFKKFKKNKTIKNLCHVPDKMCTDKTYKIRVNHNNMLWITKLLTNKNSKFYYSSLKCRK